ALAILVLSTSALGHSHDSFSPQEPERKAYQPPFRPGVSILQQARPDERVIEVLNDAPPDVEITPDAEDEIEALTRLSVAVAIVRVIDKRSAFTTTNAPPYRVPGDWI